MKGKWIFIEISMEFRGMFIDVVCSKKDTDKTEDVKIDTPLLNEDLFAFVVRLSLLWPKETFSIQQVFFIIRSVFPALVCQGTTIIDAHIIGILIANEHVSAPNSVLLGINF